ISTAQSSILRSVVGGRSVALVLLPAFREPRPDLGPACRRASDPRAPVLHRPGSRETAGPRTRYQARRVVVGTSEAVIATRNVPWACAEVPSDPNSSAADAVRARRTVQPIMETSL